MSENQTHTTIAEDHTNTIDAIGMTRIADAEETTTGATETIDITITITTIHSSIPSADRSGSRHGIMTNTISTTGEHRLTGIRILDSNIAGSRFRPRPTRQSLPAFLNTSSMNAVSATWSATLLRFPQLNHAATPATITPTKSWDFMVPSPSPAPNAASQSTALAYLTQAIAEMATMSGNN
jgi:hypothetical protein